MRRCTVQDSYTAQQIFTVDTNGLIAEKSQLGHLLQKKPKL